MTRDQSSCLICISFVVADACIFWRRWESWTGVVCLRAFLIYDAYLFELACGLVSWSCICLMFHIIITMQRGRTCYPMLLHVCLVDWLTTSVLYFKLKRNQYYASLNWLC